MEGLIYSHTTFITTTDNISRKSIKRNDSVCTDKESTIPPDSPRSIRSHTPDFLRELSKKHVLELSSSKKSNTNYHKYKENIPVLEYWDKTSKKKELCEGEEKNIQHHHDYNAEHALYSSVFDLQSLPSTCSRHYSSGLTVHHFKTATHFADGSNSNIYISEHNGKLPVALKIMKDSHILESDVVLEEFEREVDILTRLKHQNILNIYGSGHIPSVHFPGLQRPMIALELLSGGTLSTHLKKKRSFESAPYTEKSYLHIGKELADALHYLHELVHPECKIIYRDLKPDNIGFATDGTLKLMDFGLCIALKRSEHDHKGNYSLTGCTGSIKYMAPESALNKPYNEKVDIYSFGITMYEVITGCIPFTGIDKNDFYDRVIIRHFRPSLHLDDYERDITMSHELRHFIQSCWHHEAIKRPTAKQASEFFQLLLDNLENESHSKKDKTHGDEITSSGSCVIA